MLLKLLGAPITAPIAGFEFILRQLQELAERELYDEDRLREQLLELHLEADEISREEFAEREAELIGRLRVARQRRLGIS